MNGLNKTSGAMAKFRLKKSLAYRKIDGVLYVTDAVESSLHEFNGAGAIIWEMSAHGRPRSAILEKITGEYDVALATASRDIDEFLNTLEEKGLLEIVG
ncbi:MAG: PqqD family protein [Endomicrobiia bacterium]|nr:PqqD family protein [Endomicrobiia bacterium]